MKKQTLAILFTLSLIPLTITAQHLQHVSPEQAGMDSKQLLYADKAIEKAIADKEIPGAVLAVVRHGHIAYLKAYGHKQVYPATEPMDVNAVFDLASITKPVATALSAMILVERGLIRFQDRVNLYIPDFAPWEDKEGKKKEIRIVDLLTHTSGLPPYADVAELEKKYGAPNPDGLIAHIATVERNFEPQTGFQYSCLNYIALQRVIETVSKQTLRDFAKQNIFDVLGMEHTDFNPSGAAMQRAVPTEKQPDGTILKGKVHDPLARTMNEGISGNAGLFSDAEDLAVLAAALLNDGEYRGKRILSPLGVKAMRTVPRQVAALGRTPGWDIFSPYASNNGDLLGPNTYGHTGYTGTSFVIDPDNDIAVILLTNRVHPDDKGDVIRLRSLVANAVAAAITEIKD